MSNVALQRIQSYPVGRSALGVRVLARGIPIDGHDEVRFGQQGAQYVHDAVDTTERQTVGVGAANPHCGRSHREGFDDVGSAANARVEQHRQPVGGLEHSGQAIQPGKSAVGLPAAVIGAVNAVDQGLWRGAHRRGDRCPWPRHARAGGRVGFGQVPVAVLGAYPDDTDGRHEYRRRQPHSEQLDGQIAFGGAIPMRGNKPQRLKASTFTRWVCSSPASPATYPNTFGGIAAAALASNSAKLIWYGG